MKDRNKIITQLLIVGEEYDLEIIKINFTNINNIMDEVEFTFKIKDNKFIIKYLYEKDNMYDVNSVGYNIKNKLGELLKEGKECLNYLWIY